MGLIYCDIFEPAEWIRYIAIYFNLPSDCDIWPADISTKVSSLLAAHVFVYVYVYNIPNPV